MLKSLAVVGSSTILALGLLVVALTDGQTCLGELVCIGEDAEPQLEPPEQPEPPEPPEPPGPPGDPPDSNDTLPEELPVDPDDPAKEIPTIIFPTRLLALFAALGFLALVIVFLWAVGSITLFANRVRKRLLRKLR